MPATRAEQRGRGEVYEKEETTSVSFATMRGITGYACRLARQLSPWLAIGAGFHSPFGGGIGLGTRITIDFSSPASYMPVGSSSSMLCAGLHKEFSCATGPGNSTRSTYLRMRNCTFFGVALMRSCAWASVSCVASSSFISSMMSPSRTPDLSAMPLGVTCQKGKVTLTFCRYSIYAPKHDDLLARLSLTVVAAQLMIAYVAQFEFRSDSSYAIWYMETPRPAPSRRMTDRYRWTSTSECECIAI